MKLKVSRFYFKYFSLETSMFLLNIDSCKEVLSLKVSEFLKVWSKTIQKLNFYGKWAWHHHDDAQPIQHLIKVASSVRKLNFQQRF